MAVKPPPSLVVHNLPLDEDADAIELFFSVQKNGGCGDVEKVCFPVDDEHPTSARVTFSQAKTVILICSAERVMKGNKLKLEPENIGDVDKTGRSIITPLSDVNYCTQHPREEIRYMCNTQECEGIMICARCIRDEHKGHAWTFIEDELEEKKAEITKAVLPDLTTVVTSVKQGIKTLEEKQKELELGLKTELQRVENNRTTNLANLRTEYDKNLKKLKDDFDKQEDKIDEETNRVSDSVETKWDSMKTQLEEAKRKHSDQLAELNDVITLAQEAAVLTDLKSVWSTIEKATKICKAGEAVYALSSMDVTTEDTPYSLESLAELSLTLQPKTAERRMKTAILNDKVSSKATSERNAKGPVSMTELKKTTPKPCATNREVLEPKENDIVFETFHHKDGQTYQCCYQNGTRYYLDSWVTGQWQQFPTEWYKQGILVTVVSATGEEINGPDENGASRATTGKKKGGQRGHQTPFHDDREGSLEHPTLGKIETFLFEETRNIHCFYHSDTGTWVKMPISWELQSDFARELVNYISECVKDWKDKADILASLRANNYNADATVSQYFLVQSKGGDLPIAGAIATGSKGKATLKEKK